ncbi:Glycosyl phosphatidyl inositol protein transamidase complex subunit [Chytriomyces hyalinus]|nr:Glycosyl phosphatidyl inositol protein transamidase complex subunit [Chytriomyces hyalinus]
MGSLISKATATDAQRIQRARATLARALALVTRIGPLLSVFGVLGLVAIAHSSVSKKGYPNNIDENAMLPAQASVYFAPSDVRMHSVPRDSDQRAKLLLNQLQSAGLDAATQNVWVTKGNATEKFTNVYGIVRAPRASGTESVLLSAPWICSDDQFNENGFNYLMSLAHYIPKFSHWSKDLIFLFSDGGLIGTRAWLEAYHGFDDFHPDVKVSPIVYHGGVIEEALNVEFPGTHARYDTIGIYVQGLNGQQPNADVPMTAAAAASSYSVPVRLHRSRSETGQNVVNFMHQLNLGKPVMEYVEGAVGLAEFMSIQAVGIPMAHHALFPKFKIEGVTIAGVKDEQSTSATIDAQRVCLVIESTLRSFNSLLERLHHAFWFYMMFSIYDYLPIAFYIAPVILLSANLVFQAFLLFTEGEFVLSAIELEPTVDEKLKLLVRPAGVSSFLKSPRPLQLPIAIISLCYSVVWICYRLATSYPSYLDQPLAVLLGYAAAFQFAVSVLAVPILRLFIKPPESHPEQWKLLKSLTYSALGATLLTISTLNPSLSALLALPIVPTAYIAAKPSKNMALKLFRMILLQAASPVGLLGLLLLGLGEVGARHVLQHVWMVEYWLEGWCVGAVVCAFWPLCLALQILVAGF